jgi:flagellin-specific chaperone FliS
LDKYKNKKDLNNIYSIIISELERFKIENDLSSLNKLIDDNYKNDISYCDLLLNIMDSLNKGRSNFYFYFRSI